jgi:hypothetical protein
MMVFFKLPFEKRKKIPQALPFPVSRADFCLSRRLNCLEFPVSFLIVQIAI